MSDLREIFSKYPESNFRAKVVGKIIHQVKEEHLTNANQTNQNYTNHHTICKVGAIYSLHSLLYTFTPPYGASWLSGDENISDYINKQNVTSCSVFIISILPKFDLCILYFKLEAPNSILRKGPIMHFLSAI